MEGVGSVMADPFIFSPLPKSLTSTLPEARDAMTQRPQMLAANSVAASVAPAAWRYWPLYAALYRR